ACMELQQAYKDQCSTHTFFLDEIRCLTPDEMDQLLSKVNSLHLQIDTSSSDRWVVKGLKDGVNEVVRLIQDALQHNAYPSNIFVHGCLNANVFQQIQRIQNMDLRRLYEGRKIELENKNGSVGAAEKILYYGTSEESCSSIMKSNFNRNFAGQNGNSTNYGHGTYFAVNTSYSAQNKYAVPAADGTQLMFVARVLTGYYGLGQADMRTPPVHVAPDRYDSVVDNMQNPSMFVVFHDCQAYPDYLITFK
uniref:Poly [ADP-ribose] polymerase n=1 Tax=Sinocyclocheilus rhinocerous TaxID=307959 RepID=A0A673LPA2_9TELE